MKRGRKVIKGNKNKILLPGILLLLMAVSIVVGQPKKQADSSIKLARTINTLLSVDPLENANYGVEIREAESGKVIYSKNPDKLLTPASNMKLVTGAAALSGLGRSFRFLTEVYAEGDIERGVLKGDLYLKGYGDPSLVDERLWILARDVAYSGIKQIRGKIIADDTYFDGVLHSEEWGNIGPEAYYAPISALSLNFNTFVVTANPASRAGRPPKLFYMPPDKHLRLVNRALTVNGNGRCNLKVVENPERVNSYEVVGTIPVNSETTTIRRTIKDPALYTAGSFEAYLASWGVKVGGEITKGEVPKKAKLIAIRKSEPLSEIIWSMGKISNNFVAEQVLKTMCAENDSSETDSATADCGIKVVEKYLEGLDIKPESYIMVDGSGLARDNKLTPSVINRVLLAMYRNPNLWPEFAAGLSVAGIDGTLEKRFLDSPLKGKLRAKTGHLMGVNSLSGFMPTKKGKMLVFSMMFNDFAGYHSSVEEVQRLILESAVQH